MSLKMNGVRRRRLSLVRILASCIPNFFWKYLLPVSVRMCVHISDIDKVSTLKKNNFQLDESNSSFCSFKSHFHKQKQQQLLNSTPKRDNDQENSKIQALQNELDEIKKQIAKLMERQSEQYQSSDYGSLSNQNSNQSQKSYVCPPAPPPPPPPLPDLPLITNFPLKIEKKKNSFTPAQHGFPCGKELLKELKKVQLKKVEKSPGGGPLKKPKKDPGDFLEAALKKRFGYVQNSPESSTENPSVDHDSFCSGKQFSNYKLQTNLMSSLA